MATVGLAMPAVTEAEAFLISEVIRRLLHGSPQSGHCNRQHDDRAGDHPGDQALRDAKADADLHRIEAGRVAAREVAAVV